LAVYMKPYLFTHKTLILKLEKKEDFSF